MKFLSALIKHSLQPAVQSETFKSVPMANPEPNRHHFNSIDESNPDSVALMKTHASIKHENEPDNVEQSIIGSTRQQPTDRQNSVRASDPVEASATVEEAGGFDNTILQTTGISTHEPPTAAETLSTATDSPALNPVASQPGQQSKEELSPHIPRIDEQVQTIAIEQTDAFSAPRQPDGHAAPLDTNDLVQNTDLSNPLSGPEINSRPTTQHSVQPSEHARAVPVRSETIPVKEDRQQTQQASENIPVASSVMPSKPTSRQPPSVDRATSSTQPPPQVRIGHINVLIEDQAAATKPRKSTSAKTSSPSIPFGIRGL